jgi:hypothetical protein
MNFEGPDAASGSSVSELCPRPSDSRRQVICMSSFTSIEMPEERV